MNQASWDQHTRSNSGGFLLPATPLTGGRSTKRFDTARTRPARAPQHDSREVSRPHHELDVPAAKRSVLCCANPCRPLAPAENRQPFSRAVDGGGAAVISENMESCVPMFSKIVSARVAVVESTWSCRADLVAVSSRVFDVSRSRSPTKTNVQHVLQLQRGGRAGRDALTRGNMTPL